MDTHQDFLRFCLDHQVLRLGSFTTKAGRLSPYFFDIGQLHTGDSLWQLAQFYAQAIRSSGIQFDLIFGPAYKGIPLVCAVAIALGQQGMPTSFAYNRKEAKDHGEGGLTVGAPLQGKVLIVDDVLSAGTSVRVSTDIIQSAGAEVAGVVVALDRMERGSGLSFAGKELEEQGISLISIANFTHMLHLVAADPDLSIHHQSIMSYQRRYGNLQVADV